MQLPNRAARSLVALLVIGLLAAALLPLATRQSYAGQQSISIAPGDQLTITCATSLSGSVQGTEATISCAAPTATATPTAAPTAPTTSAPAITAIKGVQDGGALSGRANIEAVVSGDQIASVVFKLEAEGQPAVTHTEKQAPYWFLGDNNGSPLGWDTTKAPNGAYMLTVTASNTSGQNAAAMIHFQVANGGQAQPTPTAAANPTAAPAPTAMPPMGDMAGVCGESAESWHAPVVTGPDGKPCATGHEHGDAPPAWIAAAGYQASFHGHFNTSPLENTSKHAAMKGFAAKMKGVDIYFRIHAASNPLDRSARYHSYEVFARDPSGAVSHWQGWYNGGDPVKDRFPRRKANGDPGTRPIMLVIDQQSLNEGIDCEQWYVAPGEPSWGWDFGWTICGATTLYDPNENATAKDQSTWKLTGSLGGTRRLEAAWYASRQHPTGAFVATQFGEIVNGMADPRCAATTTKFGTVYQNVCLDQYIAPTMTEVAFPDNAVQKNFDTTGVKIPN